MLGLGNKADYPLFPDRLLRIEGPMRPVDVHLCHSELT